MLELLRDLILHKSYANAALIGAIRRHEPAANDPELRQLLHHIMLANRFWLMLSADLPFAIEAESTVPDSLDKITEVYRATDALEREWLAHVEPSDLERELTSPFFTGHTYSVAQAIMQVCLHSHGHRAQCNTRLRALGGTPPATDFVMWLPDRPAPEWN